MNPTKPDKKLSRRSSILKLPKNKNSSEYGDQAVPAEESPRKDNRRVSFAGKKHVKEFCESNFQGTVWDNTYEESDSSHMKTSQASLSDVTPPLNTSENSPIENNLYHLINPTNQQLQRIPGATNHHHHLDESNDTLVLFANKRQLSRKNQLPLNNNDLNQFIDKENIPISIETEKIESSLVEDEIIQPSHKIIDKTDNILPSFSIYCDDEENEDLKYSENNDDTVIGEQSMDCTLTANQLQVSSEKCSNNNNNSINNINESKDMELTDNISSNIYKQKNTIESKTQHFEQSEMVMTMALPSLFDKQQMIDNKNNGIISNNRMSMTTSIPSILHRPLFNDQTRKFHQSQMEMTEAIPSLLCRQITDDQSQVIKQKCMEINTTSSSVFNNKKISDDQTEVFNENRMSITSAIPSVLHNQLGEDKTMFFQHERMDTTRAIPSLLHQGMPYEQNQECNQNRMSMTAMIPSVLQHQLVKRNQQKANRQSVMEMTEAIPSVLSQDKDEQPEVINQNRMSMTAMIPSVLQHQKLRTNQQRNNRQSIMEMTEAIPSVLSQNKDEQPEVINQNRMSMTAMIPSVLQHQPTRKNQQKVNRQSIMEMTEAIPSVLSQNKDEQPEVINQNGMSMTAMIPSVLQHQKLRTNQQRSNRQSIMEMTEAIPSVLSQNKDEQPEVINQNRMSMTAMIPSVLQHQKLRTNQQRNNRQSIMEMTEAIPSVLSQNKDEQSEVINQNRMSMTTAIPSILQRQTILVNQTNNLNPMEFTEAIPSVLNQFKNTDNQDRMTVINSTSNSPSRLANEVPSASNYLDEITEPSLSLKRNYTIIRSPHNSRTTELSSPYPKLQINESSYVRKSTTTDKDREKLHRLLHKSLSEVDYLSPIPKQCKNISMELTTAVQSNYFSNKNSTDEMISVINEADNSQEINKQISTFVNSTIIPDMNDDKSIEKNQVSSFVNSTINPEDKIADKNPIESVDTSKIKDVINEEIIPAIEQTEISSSLLTENHEPIDNNLSTNKSVARELFDVNLDNNHSSNSNNESIACRHYFDDKTDDQITRPFSSPSLNMNTEATKTIRIIPNCFENIEYNHSLTISKIQQSSTDNLDAIREPSFFVNSTESVDVNAGYENEITANIKIWEQENIQQVKETVENKNKSVDDHQEIINNNEINSTDIKTQENISVVNCSEATEKHNTSIIKIKKTNKRRSLDIFDDKKITEKTKRFKLNNNYYSQASNNELSSLKFVKKPEELLINKNNNKLPIEIIESLETKQFILQSKCQLKNINEIISKNTLFLNKVMKDIDNKKKELQYYEEKMNEFSIVGNKKIVLDDNLNLNDEEDNDTSRFGVLKKSIKNYENKRECIWKIISIDSTRIIIEYYKTTIWLVIGFDVPDNTDEIEMVKGVKIIPRLHPDEIVSLKITDKLIVDQIDVEHLKDNYKTYDDVMEMIKYVDDNVKSIYDFYFELIKLDRKNLMDISVDKITFVSRTSKMRIILRVTINVKTFSKITPDDITVDCLLGNVKHSDIKNLIKNVKKNYRFLKFYIDDVRNFIELLEEAQRPKNI